MRRAFFKSVSLIAFALAAFFCLGLAAGGSWPAALGVVVGSFWMYLNSYFLFRLFDIASNRDRKNQNKIILFAIFKFPVLYVAGFFILQSHFFPVVGILLGLTSFFIAYLLTWVRYARVYRKEWQNSAPLNKGKSA